jgi:hypothetical protein
MQMTGLSDAPTAYPARRNGAAHPDDVISAIKEAKSRRARERNLIRIFLSHKKKDFKAANQIREVLRLQSAGRIDVFMSENITKRDDWQGKPERLARCAAAKDRMGQTAQGHLRLVWGRKAAVARPKLWALSRRPGCDRNPVAQG